MNSNSIPKEMIILFDEHGTPTFNVNRETDFFLGVAVTYKFSDEKHIIEKCRRVFGLQNKKPLKNNLISNNRINEILNILPNLPIQIIITSIKLSGIEFQNVIKLFKDYSNLMREKFRNVRERGLNHILRTFIVEECIFYSIVDYCEKSQEDLLFSIFIDDWSIPKSDLYIYTNFYSRSLETRINNLFDEFNFNFQISVPPINYLKNDTVRKRIIDVITSFISRSFLDIKNNKYSSLPKEKILNIDSNKYLDITDKTKNFITKFM
ncbi:hypothetical protein KJ656_08455, partial [bacterium]|nr:hypothetical protein [bacterium]